MNPLDILSDLVDITNRDEKHRQDMRLARNREQTERYTQYARTATDVVGALGSLYLDYKRTQAELKNSQPEPVYRQSEQQFVGAPQYRAALPPPPPPSAQVNRFEVDYDSIWVDDANNIIGAAVLDHADGRLRNYAYHLQRVTDSVQNILESVDGSQWQQVGVLDYDNIKAEDFGTPQAGGPIFAEIFLTVLDENQPQQELPSPPSSSSKALPAANV